MTEPLLRQRDREARHAAQTRFEAPLVLQAGAGTGKTTTLIARLLSWTLGEGWERAVRRLAERAVPGRPEEEAPDRVAADVLGRVVAITFTEAAAAEMAGRAARELAALAAGGEAAGWLDAALLPPAAERSRRARALLGTLDHLAVRTIHAFCRSLLADHPLEAGVHPEPRLSTPTAGSSSRSCARRWRIRCASPTASRAIRTCWLSPPAASARRRSSTR